MNYVFHWTTIHQYADYFYRGVFNTLLISFLSILLALILGIIFAIFRTSNYKSLSIIANTYINLIRSTPLLVQVYFIYFGLPYIDINFSAFWCGVIALVLNSGAYIAEIVRAGLQSIPEGHLEASTALGLSRIQTLRYIIMPQTLRKVIPPLIGQFTYLIKDSSILAAIGIYELTNTAKVIYARTFKPIEPMAVALLGYLLITAILMFIGNKMEKKLALAK